MGTDIRKLIVDGFAAKVRYEIDISIFANRRSQVILGLDIQQGK
jgi:hypothetical protein